jgi:hypothetical protein
MEDAVRVLAIIESPGHVCYRYRIEAFSSAMASQGMRLEAAPLPKGLWQRLGLLLAARRTDIVILQRKLLPRWQLALLRRMAKRLVFDFDDAVFQRDSFSPKGPRSSMRLAGFRATVAAADAVTAGNDYLRQYAAAYAEPSGIHTVPTCVEPDRYPVAQHTRVGHVRLVWIGQRAMLPSLQCIGEHLRAAAERLPSAQLQIICDTTPGISAIPVVLRPWSSATEAADLADADIGIAWLPDDSWSLGKCGLKVLQYMAAGLPVVANPVGENRRMVVHGKTGFLATSPEEWATAVDRLAIDPLLRAKMGSAARQTVEKHYSVAAWGPRLAALLAGSGSLPYNPVLRTPTPARAEPDALVPHVSQHRSAGPHSHLAEAGRAARVGAKR